MSESEIQRSLGRIEGKLDTIIDQHNTRIGNVEKNVKSLARRDWIAALIGAILGIGGSHGLKI